MPTGIGLDHHRIDTLLDHQVHGNVDQVAVLDRDHRRHDAANRGRHAPGGDHCLHRIGDAGRFQGLALGFLATAAAIGFFAQGSAMGLDLGNDQIAKLAGRDFSGAFHLPGEVVGDGLVGDHLGQRGLDQVGRFLPAHVLQHHHARQQQRAGIDLVEIGVLGRGAVGGFEHGDVIGHVGAGRDTDTTDFSGDRVGQVVTIQVHGGQHRELFRTQLQQLEDDVGDAVLDHHLAGRLLAAVDAVQVVLGDGLVREFITGDFIAPVPEGAFRELHDVALVNQGHAVQAVVDGVLNGLAHQPLGGERRDRLDTQTGVIEEISAQFLAQELGQLGVLRRAGLVLDTGVDVLGVLAEDDDIHLLGIAHRRGYARVVAHRAHAGVQVEILAQGDVQRAETTTDRRGQGALDGDDQFLDRFQGFLGEVVAVIDLGGFLTQENFAPVDLAIPGVGFFDRRIPDPQRGAGDVGADTVAFDIADDRLIGNVQFTVLDGDLFAALGNADMLVSHEPSFSLWFPLEC